MRVVCLFYLCLFTLIAQSKTVSWNDGDSHVVDNSSYWQDYLLLDNSVNNIPGTRFILERGGIVDGIRAYNHSYATINDGRAESAFSYNNSTIAVSGGWVGTLFGFDNSSVCVSGGMVGTLYTFNNTNVTISGDADCGKFLAINNTTVTMSGGSVYNFDLIDDCVVQCPAV